MEPLPIVPAPLIRTLPLLVVVPLFPSSLWMLLGLLAQPKPPTTQVAATTPYRHHLPIANAAAAIAHYCSTP
jgi:hypothetical protein